MRWLRMCPSFVVVALASCGGKVIVDETPSTAAGSGGSPASSSSATVSSAAQSSASSGGGADCAALEADYMMKLDAARACAPSLDVIQCDGSATVPDTCGCSIVVNETQPALVQAAKAAWMAQKFPVCGPFDCPRGADPLCTPMKGAHCQPSADMTTGTCEWDGPQ